MASFYSMPTIVEVIDTFIKPHYKKILIVVALIVFSVSAYYIYNKWNQPVANKYKDIYQPNDDGANEATVYFFFADWCPHCKAAKPVWIQFKEEYHGKIINGNQIICRDIDCTDDTNDPNDKISALISQYKVESFPTIIMLVGENRIDFDAKITKSALDQFVKSAIA